LGGERDSEVYWVPIVGFEDYVIFSDGRVVRLEDEVELFQSPVTGGDMTVAMWKDGRRYRRSVKVLVAEAFVEGKDGLFDTPVLLNQVRWDLRAENIVWRPRWFAWRYTRQFQEPRGWHFTTPVLEVFSNTEYDHIFHAATTHGLLCNDIHNSVYNDRRVYPLGHLYKYITV